MSDQTTFGTYGSSFQDKVMQAFLTDARWSEQMMEIFNSSYFDKKYLVYLAEKFFAYAKKYKAFPTFQLLVTIVRDDLHHGKDTMLRDQVVEYLVRTKSNPNPGDLGFVKDKALDFCRKQALKSALEQAVDHMANENYDMCVEVVKKAVLAGSAPSVGHEFLEDFDARFSNIHRKCTETGFSELDRKEILNGGLGSGELGIVVASTGVGKSHMLTFLGANALRKKKNVLHYTFELSETQIGVRYDSNICDIDSNLVLDHKESIIESYNKEDLGRLFIKHYPANTATIYTLKSHIERLSITKNFIPDIIIVDYADIMRSTRQYDSLRHELKLVYEELRSLADELKVAIWSASQSNREGTNANIVDLNNMSEAFAKAQVADFVMTLSRKSSEKATGAGRLFIAKNRAGRDGIVYPLLIDTATSNFKITGDPGSFTDEQAQDENEMKRKMLKRWKELSEDKNIKKGGIYSPTNDDVDKAEL